MSRVKFLTMLVGCGKSCGENVERGGVEKPVEDVDKNLTMWVNKENSGEC